MSDDDDHENREGGVRRRKWKRLLTQRWPQQKLSLRQLQEQLQRQWWTHSTHLPVSLHVHVVVSVSATWKMIRPDDCDDDLDRDCGFDCANDDEHQRHEDQTHAHSMTAVTWSDVQSISYLRRPVQV